MCMEHGLHVYIVTSMFSFYDDDDAHDLCLVDR